MSDDIQQATGTLDRMRYSVGQKTEMYSMFGTILDRLDELQRGPDPWEETCLVLTLSYMEAGLYDRAQTELQACIIPVGERPSWREAQINRNPQRYTVTRLRTRLEGAKAANR